MTLVDAECTFQPNTALTRGRPSTGSPGEETTYDRLYARAQESEKKRLEKAAKLDDNCTFSPAITKRAGAKARGDANGRRTHETLYEMVC